jgi:hypothetical protein
VAALVGETPRVPDAVVTLATDGLALVEGLYVLWCAAAIVCIAVTLIPARAVSVALAFSLIGSWIGIVVGAAGPGIDGVPYWAAIVASWALVVGGVVGAAIAWRGAHHGATSILVAAAVASAVGGSVLAGWVRRSLVPSCLYRNGAIAGFCHLDGISAMIGADALLVALLFGITGALSVRARRRGAAEGSAPADDPPSRDAERAWWLERPGAPR